MTSTRDRHAWTPAEIERLKAIYTTAKKADLEAAFPDHSWNSIKNCGLRFGMRRPLQPVPPVVDDMIREGYRTGVSDTDLGKAIAKLTGKSWPRERVGARARATLGLSRPEGYAAAARAAAVKGYDHGSIRPDAIDHGDVARFMAADFRPYELRPRTTGKRMSGCVAHMLPGGSGSSSTDYDRGTFSSTTGRQSVRRAA